jgi:hypothetical protein
MVTLAGLGSVLLWPGGALAAATQPGGERPPGGNFTDPVVRQVDIAQPAVVRIGTSERATIDVQLCTRAVRLPLNGGTYSVDLTGSGAFVSANGDILTADHVVDPPGEFVAEFAAVDIAELLNNASAFDPGCRFPAVTADDVANGAADNLLTPHVSSRRSIVWMGTAFSGPVSYSKLSEVPTLDATIVANSSYTQDDVALIHVDLTDTPSIQLDNSTAVAVEDNLIVIGFPGNGDVNENPTNFLTSSVNEVLVSSIKAADNGSELIQVGGNVEHGDSGGPAIDAAGHIVGIVSFGGPDPRGITSFLRASNNALDVMQSHDITTTPGAFQQEWSQAFTDYAATYPGHWHTAAQEMGAIASSYPTFAGLTPYLHYAQVAEASESVSNGGTVSGTALEVGVAIGVLVLLLGGGAAILYLYMRGRRRQRTPTMLSSGGATSYGGYATPAPPYGAIYPPGYGPSGRYGPPAGYPPPMQSYGPPAVSLPLGGGAGGSGSGTGEATGACVNGHPLSPGQPMCPWCGAPRVHQSVPDAVQAARLPTQDR